MVDQVLIVGGGIGGVAAATALSTAGIKATVLERRPADDNAGAVVRVNPNAMDALRAVGVEQAVIAESFPLLRSDRIGPDGRRLGFRLTADPTSQRGMARAMHWSQLSAALRTAAADRGAVIENDRVVLDVTETRGGVEVRFDDDTIMTGRLLIGADGVFSRVRTAIDPDAPAPHRLGTRTVYGFAPDPGCEPPPPEALRSFVGPGGFFAVTRDSRSGGCFWFTSLRATADTARNDSDQLRAQLLEAFPAGPGPAPTIIRNSPRILSFDDHSLAHLPRWHTDRMIVIGDAAHVAAPASESGAAMAIEDGVLLGRCLRDHATGAEAFTAFERHRRARVEAVVALGTRGTTAVHHHRLRRRLRAWRDRAASFTTWQRRPAIGGPAWLLDHHLEWDRPPATTNPR